MSNATVRPVSTATDRPVTVSSVTIKRQISKSATVSSVTNSNEAVVNSAAV